MWYTYSREKKGDNMCNKNEKQKALKESMGPIVRAYRAAKVSKESIYRICTANTIPENISINKIINGPKR